MVSFLILFVNKVENPRRGFDRPHPQSNKKFFYHVLKVFSKNLLYIPLYKVDEKIDISIRESNNNPA